MTAFTPTSPSLPPTASERGRHPPQRGAREVLALTFGLWTLAYVLMIIPEMTFGDFDGAIFLLVTPTVVFGFIISGLLYAFVRSAWPRALGPRLVLLVLTVVALSFVHGMVNAFTWDLVSQRLLGKPGMPERFWNISVTTGLIYLGAHGFYTTAVALLLTNLRYRDRERELAEARAAAHQAQTAALRFQLNPHFLFNTLNAVSSLVVTGRNDDAELMIGKLSDFLRASINSDPEGEVPLDDELATLQAYLDIEAVRFGERLTVEVVSPAHLLDALVPSFVLQPLVENAVKYAVAPSRRPVAVRVEAREEGEDLIVSVEDDGGQAFGVLPKGGTGVGLDNIRKRLRAAYGARGDLQATARDKGWASTIRLPLHRATAPAAAAAAAPARSAAVTMAASAA